MRKVRPAPPILGDADLADRLSRLHHVPFSAARAAADWLLTPCGDWPELLAPYHPLCPDPASLRRLIAIYDPIPPSPEGGNALLAHLQGGWRDGSAPAPWFDPMGYEVLSAARRDPDDAAILHYAREGWARGLDPDPRRVCDLSRVPGRSLLLHASSDADRAAVLDRLARQLPAPPGPDAPEWILLDTGATHATARAVADRQGAALRAGRLRLLAAPPGTDPAALAALVRAEAAAPVLLPPAPIPQDLPIPRPLPAPPAHLLGRRARLRRGEIAPRITIRCPAPDMARAHRWGDFHFAESLAAALERAGARPRIALAEDWQTEEDPAPDATLLLRGVRRRRPQPGPVNLMWMLSHPDRVETEELARYDHVFVASLPHARQLQRDLGDRVSALLQCSDPDRFAPQAADPGAEHDLPAHDLLFVGNSRRAERWIVSAALQAGHALSIYGAEWEDTPAAAHVIAESLPNRRLGGYYRRAGIVLNDHWPDMAARGFVSNRLFDIAMAGGFPISDIFAGAGMFFGLLPQVRDAAELDRAIEYFTTHPESRARRAAALHALVRHSHTFDARAAGILTRLRHLF